MSNFDEFPPENVTGSVNGDKDELWENFDLVVDVDDSQTTDRVKIESQNECSREAAELLRSGEEGRGSHWQIAFLFLLSGHPTALPFIKSTLGTRC